MYDSPKMVYNNSKINQEGMHMKLSARNQLRGRIVDIKTGSVNDIVILDIGNKNQVTAVITKDSVNNLGLKVGDEAYAVIKASEVMVGTDS